MGGILGGGQQQVPFNAMGSGLGGTVFAPPQQSLLAGDYRNILDNMLNTWGSNYQMLLPQIAAAGRQQMGAANQVSGMASPLLQSSMAESNRLFGLAPQISGMAPQFMGQAASWLNPAQTSPIFQQMANQAQQGAAAANAASGVYGPYAAGTTNEALNNLRLGWAAQAPQVASGLASTGANLATSGAGLGGQAQQQGQQALLNYLSMVGKPQQQAIQDQLGNTNNLFSLPQQIVQDILPYLHLGQAASQLSGSLGQMGFNQNQQQLGNIGGLASSLLGAGPMGQLLWGPGGGAFGSGMGLFGGAGGGVLGGLLGGGGMAGGIPGAAGIMDAGSGLGFGDLAGALFGFL